MASRPSTFPAYRAQLAQLVSDPPEGDGWLHEVKYDGYRIGCATSFAKAGRERQVLVDYLRNNRTDTSVAALSTRAPPAGS